jgi:hypothetical protein
MKVSKFRAGDYIITLHGYSFTLEKMTGDKYWRLYNDKQIQVNDFETKSGAIKLMIEWSTEKAARYANENI